MHHREVDALEQPMQLLNRELGHHRSRGPNEPVLLQALEQQPKAVALPGQDLDPVAPAVAEHKHARSERVQAKGLLDQHRRAVDAQPEIHRLAVQVDLQPFVEAEHRSLPSASIISPT